jgi:nitrile hydratase beta subunit
MNGVHDMGGMHGMGPIQHEKTEPVFHAPWEARVFALVSSMGDWRKWNVDAFRHQLELIPASEYLRMSYYERWFVGLIELIVRSGLIDRAELESGVPASRYPLPSSPLTAEQVRARIAKGAPASREIPLPARFRKGQRVRARNMNPIGHTRLPRYARGKLGTVERDRGAFVFADTNAHFLGENPQHVYSVRFGARELWGDQAAPRDAVYIDVWEDYLEPA